MVREISNMDDMIDSRDVIARIEELESEREAIEEEIEEYAHAEDGDDDEDEEGDDEEKEKDLERLNDAKESLKDWDRDYSDELKALKSLAEDGANSADDWEYGATLIRDSYFVEAMQELCEDIGDLPKGLPSYLEIDWDATARNLQSDYSSVEFDGVTYWVR
jgi:DNA repair exonuclease SbcCD ATPase subunit